MKILIVEDNEDNAVVLSKLLKHEIAGVEISVKRTLRDALASVDDFAADITLLDLMLPGSSMDEVIDAIPLFHPPVVVFSGITDERTLVRCYAKGAKDFVTKGAIEFLIKAVVRAYLASNAPKELAKLEASNVE